MDKDSISATVLTVADSHDQHSFAEYIVAKFANDDVGNICRTDVTLMKIGKSLWHEMQHNPGKNAEVKKSHTMKQKMPPADGCVLQGDLNSLHRWSKHWKMASNTTKCHVLHITRNRRVIRRQYNIGETV